MTVIGMVGAGHMGAGLGWALREAGNDVITSLEGRSARSARLAAEAGLRVVPRLTDVLASAEVILVVTPPGAAADAARDIAEAFKAVMNAPATRTSVPSGFRTAAAADGSSAAGTAMPSGSSAAGTPVPGGSSTAGTAPGGSSMASTAVPTRAPTDHPVVVDLNAIAPATSRAVGEIIMQAGLDYVDGAISGVPPTVRPGANIYLSGSRANEIAVLSWKHVNPIVVGTRIGAASAVKMSTASVYKGLTGLLTQAMRSAEAYGVLDTVMADLGSDFGSPYSVALAATKAYRYVPEMLQIAKAQQAVGLTPALFEALAAVWADVADTSLAEGDPEALDRGITAHEVTKRLRSDT